MSNTVGTKLHFVAHGGDDPEGYTAELGSNGNWCITWPGGPSLKYNNDLVEQYFRQGIWILKKVETPKADIEVANTFQRISALQAKGVRVLFDTDMTINIRGTDVSGTTVGFLGLAGTQERVDAVLTRAENIFGKG